MWEEELKLEKTPEVENKYKEVSLEDKKAEIEKIKSSMSEDEIKDTFTIKPEEKKDVSVVKADTTPVEDPKPGRPGSTRPRSRVLALKPFWLHSPRSGSSPLGSRSSPPARLRRTG